MNETLINTKFAALVEQRNQALNIVVNLSGDLAVALEKIKALEAKLAAPEVEVSND